MFSKTVNTKTRIEKDISAFEKYFCWAMTLKMSVHCPCYAMVLTCIGKLVEISRVCPNEKSKRHTT